MNVTEFLQMYWPQLVILAALIVVIIVFMRRMPKTDEQVMVAEKTVHPKRDVRGAVSGIATKIKEGILLGYERLRKWAHKGKEVVLRKKKKEEASAVSSMFDAPKGGAAISVPKVTPTTPTKFQTVPKRPLGSRMSLPSLGKKAQADKIEKKRKSDELIRRAKQYLNENRNKDAESTFIEAVTLNPRDERIYIELGNMYLKVENYTDAHSSYLEAHKLKSNDVDVLSKLGLISYRMKKFDEAVKHYEAATKLQPLEAKHVANLGLALRAAGNSKKAFKAYSKAFEMKNGELDYAIKAFELALEIGKGKKAETILLAAEKLDSKNVRVQELRNKFAALQK
jgi:Flp pilus assembly protein TadD